MNFFRSLVAIALVVSFMLPQSVLAEAPRGDQYFSAEHRQKLYDEGSKSETTALLWTLAFPPLGDIYAEEYFWAGITGIMMVFAGTFVGFALTTSQDTFLVWGGVTAGLSYATAGVTSVLGVRAYNHELKRALNVQASQPTSRGISISFSW